MMNLLISVTQWKSDHCLYWSLADTVVGVSSQKLNDLLTWNFPSWYFRACEILEPISLYLYLLQILTLVIMWFAPLSMLWSLICGVLIILFHFCNVFPSPVSFIPPIHLPNIVYTLVCVFTLSSLLRMPYMSQACLFEIHISVVLFSLCCCFVFVVVILVTM